MNLLSSDAKNRPLDLWKADWPPSPWNYPSLLEFLPLQSAARTCRPASPRCSWGWIPIGARSPFLDGIGRLIRLGAAAARVE